jgi:hypothetical protein
MRGRDVLIVAAVLLVGGFALADALRGNESDDGRRTATAALVPPPEPGVTARTETVQGLPTGRFGGRIVFTDEGCNVREIDLASGTLFPFPRIPSTCTLVSAPRTERIAIGLRSSRRDVGPYRVLDLNRPSADLVAFRAQNSSVVWSGDGRFVAWCEPSGRGRDLDLDLGREIRTLPGCAVAYSGARPLYVRGRGLFLGPKRLVEAPHRILAASVGTDGTLAIADADGLIHVATRPDRPFDLDETRPIPPELRGLPILFSPTNCNAAVVSTGPSANPTVSVLNIRPCGEARPPSTFPGHAASWAPDGLNLAVAEREQVTIHPMRGDDPVIRIPVVATDLGWKA